jgi:hypothetical protein
MKSIMLMPAVFVSLMLSGCATLGMGPMGTGEYTPKDDHEKIQFEKANRNIYPDDVRKDTTIAWAGIIKETTMTEVGNRIEVIILVDHHYYDWLVGINSPYGTYWLSPRGEGAFKAKGRYDSVEQAKKWVSKGNMVIVYGTPAVVDGNGVILIDTIITKTIRSSFNTYVLDYGRSEHPF